MSFNVSFLMFLQILDVVKWLTPSATFIVVLRPVNQFGNDINFGGVLDCGVCVLECILL